MFTFGHCPNQGGGGPCPNFLALFSQSLGPKIGKFLLKSHNICNFFVRPRPSPWLLLFFCRLCWCFWFQYNFQFYASRVVRFLRRVQVKCISIERYCGQTFAPISLLPSHPYPVSAQVTVWLTFVLRQSLVRSLKFLPISTLARLDLPTPAPPMIRMRGQGYLMTLPTRSGEVTGSVGQMKTETSGNWKL